MYDRMYDAIGASIVGLQQMTKDVRINRVTPDAVYELLLLTDGGDNYSSQYTLQEVADVVAHPGLPNFHLILVAVEMSVRDKENLQTVLCAPNHATFIDVRNLSDLQQTLRGVAASEQQRLVVMPQLQLQPQLQRPRLQPLLFRLDLELLVWADCPRRLAMDHEQSKALLALQPSRAASMACTFHMERRAVETPAVETPAVSPLLPLPLPLPVLQQAVPHMEGWVGLGDVCGGRGSRRCASSFRRGDAVMVPRARTYIASRAQRCEMPLWFLENEPTLHLEYKGVTC